MMAEQKYREGPPLNIYTKTENVTAHKEPGLCIFHLFLKRLHLELYTHCFASILTC